MVYADQNAPIEGEGLEGGDVADLDSVLAELKQQVEDWDTLTFDARQEAFTDRDYADGRQWTRDEAQALNDRKQPAVVFDIVGPKVEYILGSEIQSRVDPRALPRTPAHELEKDAATDAIRYIADVDKFDRKRSLVAADMFVEGIGGVVFDDVEDEREGFSTHVPYDRLFYDPFSRDPNFEDKTYCGELLWKPIGQARREYPEFADIIDATAKITSAVPDRPRWYDGKRNRVQIAEHFFQAWDTETKRMEWFEACYIGGGFLYEPTRVTLVDERGHTLCPMLLVSGYVSGGTSDANDRRGIVRPMRGPQDEVNHGHSKFIHTTHTTRVIYEEWAIPNIDAFQAQNARPDGAMPVAPGALDPAKAAIKLLDNQALEMSQIERIRDAKAHLEAYGPRPVAAQPSQGDLSGRLFIAQQEAGNLQMTRPFDNLATFTLEFFRRYWYRAKGWKGPKWARIGDASAKSGFRFLLLNRPTTKGKRLQELVADGADLHDAVVHVFGAGDGTEPGGEELLEMATKLHQEQMKAAQPPQAPGQPPAAPPQMSPEQMQQAIVELLVRSPPASQPFTAANLAQLDVDLVLDTSPHSPIASFEQYKEFASLLKEQLLPGGPKAAKLLIEMGDFRDKKRLLDIVQEGPDPATAQFQQQQMQLQLAELQGVVAKLQSETAKNQAQTQATLAEANLGTPAAARLDVAQADLAAAKAQAVPHEAQLTQAQTMHTAVLAGRESVPSAAPPGAQGPLA